MSFLSARLQTNRRGGASGVTNNNNKKLKLLDKTAKDLIFKTE